MERVSTSDSRPAHRRMATRQRKRSTLGWRYAKRKTLIGRGSGRGLPHFPHHGTFRIEKEAIRFRVPQKGHVSCVGNDLFLICLRPVKLFKDFVESLADRVTLE